VVRCPICTQNQLVYVQGPNPTSCYYCGATWVQSGDDQEGVIGLRSPKSAVRSGRLHPTTFHPTTEATT
jgi:hypothetical protein